MSTAYGTAPAITLLTDFGTADGYVAELKGVLVSRAPGVPLVDLSHDIAPQDVSGARLSVARYWRRFPVGTVHLVVVDPGVGSTRAAIAVESERRFLVGPDNGVLSPALFTLDARVIELPVELTASPTFHGRDVFAPAAAALATGAPFDSLGHGYDRALRLRTPQPVRTVDGSLLGEVLTIDRFGNAITNLAVRDGGLVMVAERTARLVRTYADAAPGEVVAVTGSNGFLELALRDGHAAAALGLSRGAPVRYVPTPKRLDQGVLPL